MYNLNYKFIIIFIIIFFNLLININCLFENKWISSKASKISTSEKDTKITITTFENQTIYLPCAMQSMNFQQSIIQDQLTLILWYRSWNIGGLIGPPIYSIDFRNLNRINSIKKQQQQNAIHFISNGEFRDRILFEFNTCWLSETYQINFYKSLNKTKNQLINYQNLNKYFYNNYQFNNSELINQQHLNKSDHLIKKNFINHFEPICAFLKLDQVKKTDSGRFSCRIDFRRSRTLFSQFLIKVLEQPKIFQIQINDRIFVNNSIISELNEGSSLIAHCSTRILDKNDVYLDWQCDNQLNNFYTNENQKNMDSDLLVNKLNIKHLYRIFNEKSCSCYLISNSGQRLMYLKFYFQLYLAPLKVSLIKKDENNLNENRLQNLIFKKRILQLDADQLSTVKCIAKGSRPAATCSWSLLNGFQFKSKDYSESTLIESVSNDSSQLTVATISTLHLLATNQMHNQIIRCICLNPLLPTIQIADQIQLEIQSKPILHLVTYELNKNLTKFNKKFFQYDNLYQTYKHQVRDGDLVKLNCNVLKSNPSLIGDIKWFINDLELDKFKKLYPNATVEIESTSLESTAKLIIQKVNRETIGHYFCMAKNEKGEAKSNLIILDVQYVPFCRPQQKNLYTLALGETIEIDCDLYGIDILHDTQTQFYWSLNKQQLSNTMFTIESLSNISVNNQIRWSNFEINENHIHNLIRNKLKFNSSNYQFKHATLACWATNYVGTQIEPCLFNLLVIDRPEKPKNCSIQYYDLEDNHSECQIEFGCIPGNNNGLQQKLHLNIYEITGGLTIFNTSTFNNLNLKANDEFNNSKLIMSDHVLNTNHPTIIQYKTNFIRQFNNTNFFKLSNCCLDKNQVVSDLIVNQTISIKINQYTRFKRFNLSTIKNYLFIIYASNLKGLSELVEFEWMFNTDTTMTPPTSLNHFQYFILIAYALVGTFLCILLTYLLKLQLLIFNYRLLSSKNNQKIIQSTNQDRPFLINSTDLTKLTDLSNNRLSKSCNNINRKINNLNDNKYLFKTIDRTNLTKINLIKSNLEKFNQSNFNRPNFINNLSNNTNLNNTYSFSINHLHHNLSSYLIANNYQTQSNKSNKI